MGIGEYFSGISRYFSVLDADIEVLEETIEIKDTTDGFDNFEKKIGFPKGMNRKKCKYVEWDLPKESRENDNTYLSSHRLQYSIPDNIHGESMFKMGIGYLKFKNKNTINVIPVIEVETCDCEIYKRNVVKNNDSMFYRALVYSSLFKENLYSLIKNNRNIFLNSIRTTGRGSFIHMRGSEEYAPAIYGAMLLLNNFLDEINYGAPWARCIKGDTNVCFFERIIVELLSPISLERHARDYLNKYIVENKEGGLDIDLHIYVSPYCQNTRGVVVPFSNKNINLHVYKETEASITKQLRYLKYPSLPSHSLYAKEFCFFSHCSITNKYLSSIEYSTYIKNTILDVKYKEILCLNGIYNHKRSFLTSLFDNSHLFYFLFDKIMRKYDMKYIMYKENILGRSPDSIQYKPNPFVFISESFDIKVGEMPNIDIYKNVYISAGLGITKSFINLGLISNKMTNLIACILPISYIIFFRLVYDDVFEDSASLAAYFIPLISYILMYRMIFYFGINRFYIDNILERQTKLKNDALDNYPYLQIGSLFHQTTDFVDKG